jgi:replicative superfamily II helicase
MSEPFGWGSPTGHALCRQILKDTQLQYEPHDCQIEGVCQSLDGINFLASTPTGSGETSYYIMYILVVLAVIDKPSLCLSAKFPKNPRLIVICPTIPLQLEMVSD